jgi:ADP-ribosylation factor-like protein 6
MAKGARAAATQAPAADALRAPLAPPRAHGGGRRVVVKDELTTLLEHPDLGRAAPLLLLANKKDLPSALSPAEIAQALQLEDIRQRPWHIAPSDALSGDGLGRAVDWLADQLLRR